MLNPAIFREYDIRGVADTELASPGVVELGRGLGTFLQRQSGRRIGLACDCRLSSPRLHDALLEGLLASGCEVTDVGVEHATLIYQASLQSANLDGKAFLEMWVRIPGKGEFFSRGLDRPITGTMSWMTVATPFFLQAGQKPDLIRLNLVVQGKGRVWIDDVHLVRETPPSR